LGANVTIIGDIKIGDNVIVGAGSVIINDIPDNAIVAGVPGRVIRIVEK
jgi:serine acetyltransferase